MGRVLVETEVKIRPNFTVAPSLLLTAWAEIFANAEMFGGRESISFKMKYKSLSRATRAIRKAIKI